MSDVTRKAEYLFDEIGLIDDALVAEAMREGGAHRTALSLRRVTVAAVAAAMLFTATVGLTLSALIRRSDKSDDSPTHDGMIEQITLGDALVRAELSGAQVYAEAQSIDLFDGKTKIIWQGESTDSYYTLDVSSVSDRQRLERALDATYSTSETVGTESDVRVWISYGDGSVISPYLRESAGNVGYGELFDYSPEIVPADDLAKLIDDLITP